MKTLALIVMTCSCSIEQGGLGNTSLVSPEFTDAGIDARPALQGVDTVVAVDFGAAAVPVPDAAPVLPPDAAPLPQDSAPAPPPDTAPIPPDTAPACDLSRPCRNGELVVEEVFSSRCSGPNEAGGLPKTPNVPGSGGACINGKLFSTGGQRIEGQACPFNVVFVAAPQYVRKTPEALWTATEPPPSASSWATFYAVWRSTPTMRYCCDDRGSVRKVTCP